MEWNRHNYQYPSVLTYTSVSRRWLCFGCVRSVSFHWPANEICVTSSRRLKSCSDIRLQPFVELLFAWTIKIRHLELKLAVFKIPAGSELNNNKNGLERRNARHDIRIDSQVNFWLPPGARTFVRSVTDPHFHLTTWRNQNFVFPLFLSNVKRIVLYRRH